MEAGLGLLFDSTKTIDVLRGRAEAVELLNLAFETAETVYTSAMNVAEVYGGLRPAEETRINLLLESFECLPITFEIARRAGHLRSQSLRAGRTYSIQDMIVAATALEHDLLVVTDNRKDFQIEGIRFWPR